MRLIIEAGSCRHLGDGIAASSQEPVSRFETNSSCEAADGLSGGGPVSPGKMGRVDACHCRERRKAGRASHVGDDRLAYERQPARRRSGSIEAHDLPEQVERGCGDSERRAGISGLQLAFEARESGITRIDPNMTIVGEEL